MKHSDGSGPLAIGPIQAYLGIGQVRIVAVAGENPATFKAKLEPVNLSGDWLFSMKKLKVDGNSCVPDQAGSSMTVAPKDDALATLGRLTTPKGSWSFRDSRARGDLEWSWPPAKRSSRRRAIPT